MDVARVALNVLIAAMLLATGGGKVTGASSSDAIRDSLNVPAGRWKLVGTLELLGVVGMVVGMWLPAAALAASLGVAALVIGAVIVRRRAGQGWRGGVAGDVVVFVLAITTAVLNAKST